MSPTVYGPYRLWTIEEIIEDIGRVPNREDMIEWLKRSKPS